MYIESLHNNGTWDLVSYLKIDGPQLPNRSTSKKKAVLGLKMQGGKHVWLLVAVTIRKVLTLMRVCLSLFVILLLECSLLLLFCLTWG